MSYEPEELDFTQKLDRFFSRLTNHTYLEKQAKNFKCLKCYSNCNKCLIIEIEAGVSQKKLTKKKI